MRLDKLGRAPVGEPARPQTLAQLLDGLPGFQQRGASDLPISGVAYHSREVVPGGIFVALKGWRTDGHRFLEDSLTRGARVIVTEQDLIPPPGVTVVRVPDARRALAHLSAAFYGHPSRDLVLVGITGTNGKTTTSYLLEAILGAAGRRVGVVGTINYRIGPLTRPAPVTTPESLDLQRLLREMQDALVSHALIEVSSHALDLSRVDCTRFAAGVFTNLSQDHLDFHQDLDSYFAAKARLFTEILPAGGGLAVLNLDDPRGRELHRRLKGPRLTYGLHPESEVRPLTYRLLPDALEALIETPSGRMEIFSRLVGPFNLANILAAAATALGLGFAPGLIADGIADLSGVPGRLERLNLPGGPQVFVDYAHTPEALALAQAALRRLGFSRLITVFGCGGDRDRGKRPLMGQAAAQASDLVVVTSDNPRSEEPLAIIEEIEAGLKAAGFPQLNGTGARRGERGYLVIPDRREAISVGVNLAGPEDAVLVAGKGHEDYQILGDERRHFDDREEALKALEEYSR